MENILNKSQTENYNRKTEDKYSIKTKLIITGVFALMIIVVIIIFNLQAIKQYFFPPPIKTVINFHDGRTLNNNNYYYNEEINYLNINWIEISEENNKYVSSGKINLSLDENKNITISEGLIFLTVANGKRIKIKDRFADVNNGFIGIYNPYDLSLYVISGSAVIDGTQINSGYVAKLIDNNLQISSFDRNILKSNENYLNLYKTLESKNILPEGLLDIDPPAITDLFPSDNYEANIEILSIKGKTEQSALIKINNENVLINPDGTFSKDYTLNIGNNIFELIIADKFDNKYIKNITIIRKDICEGVKDCGKCGNPACESGLSASTKKIENNIFVCDNAFNIALLGFINEYRIANGKNSLSLNNMMSKAACSHSKWMSDTNSFSHTGENGSQFYERCDAAGTVCDGENLAYGVNNAKDVFEMWKESPPHNANMLSDHTSMGAGLYGIYSGAVFY